MAKSVLPELSVSTNHEEVRAGDIKERRDSLKLTMDTSPRAAETYRVHLVTDNWCVGEMQPF